VAVLRDLLPAGVAETHEIPEEFGVWLQNGPIEAGTLDLVRPARHVPCKLPFQVWMALAKATPATLDAEATQRELGDTANEDESGSGLANDAALPKGGDA